MKHALVALLLCARLNAQLPKPGGGGGGGGVGIGASNLHASIAGPATTSGAIDITSLSLSTQALQNTLIADCWTGTGFSGDEVTGDLAPLACSITSRSASAATVTFSSSSNVLVVLNSNGGAGATGGPGGPGPAGDAATVAVGTVTTGAAGSSASVTNVGTSAAAIFDFAIPRGNTGVTGSAATVAVGTVTTGASGSSATVTNVGTSGAAIFDFTIPRGDPGAPGGVQFTVSGSDPMGACTEGSVHFNNSADSFWVCNNGTWSPQLQYFKSASAPTTCSADFAGAIHVRTTNGAVYACDGSNYQLVGGAAITSTTVSFSATPTFTRTTSIQHFKLTLTGNVTSSTLSGASAGDILTFELCQDGTGGRTFAWPSGFTKASTIDGGVSKCSQQTFKWDGSAAIPLAPMSSDGTSCVNGATACGITFPAVDGVVVLDTATQTLTNKTLTAPTIGSFANAAHDHSNAAGGGALAAAYRTRQFSFMLGAENGSVLVDGDDQPTIFHNLMQGITITGVSCESDAGTPSINLQRDDGSAANILSSNLSCSTSGAAGTIDTAEDNVANGNKIDFVMVAAGGAAKRITVSILYTVD